MDFYNLQQMAISFSGLAVLITGLTQMLKISPRFDYIKQYLPLVLGIILSAFLMDFEVESIIVGLMVGLQSMGIYDAGKHITSKLSTSKVDETVD